MPLFKKKKSEETGSEAAEAAGAGNAAGIGEGAGATNGDEGFDYKPDKADKFFKHAVSMHDTTNYAYAMTLWLQGMRFDPTRVETLEKYFNSAMNFGANSKAKGPTKEQSKAISGGKAPIDRYLQALLQWGAKPIDWQHGLKAMEEAAKMGLVEQVRWIGEQIMPPAQNGKAKKDTFVKMMDLFRAAGAVEWAERAGEAAIAMDPSDVKLVNRVKNLSAEATMSRGGFEGGVQEGHFRRNIKNSEKQRELEEEDSLSKTEETLERLIERSKTRLRENPDDQDTVGKLGRHLLERGTKEDEKAAYKLFIGAHERFGSYRWKQMAGDISMRVGRRKLAELRRAAEASPNDQKKQATYKQAHHKLLEHEVKEYEERVKNYPTEFKLRYELGRRLFELERYEEAIDHLQRSKDVSGVGIASRRLLAESFAALGWSDEAEDTFRDAIASHPTAGDDLGLRLRYGLMVVLKKRAKDESNLDAAREASDLAGKIAMENFGYRDIKEQREELQELVKQLREN